MNSHVWLTRIITGLISFLDATNLRNRLYVTKDRVDTLEVALEDIARINASEAGAEERTRLIAKICLRVGRATASEN
jgi:hypothetical protein